MDIDKFIKENTDACMESIDDLFNQEPNCLWEILVPTKYNDGRPVKTRHHRVWDKTIKNIAGTGITIMPPTIKGEWVCESGINYVDRTIPVRLMATETQMDEISNFTILHYQQEAVMYYKISNEVVIKKRN